MDFININNIDTLLKRAYQETALPLDLPVGDEDAYGAGYLRFHINQLLKSIINMNTKHDREEAVYKIIELFKAYGEQHSIMMQNIVDNLKDYFRVQQQ